MQEHRGTLGHVEVGGEGRVGQGFIRRGGVYLMPNGLEVVAGVTIDGSGFLYHPLIWEGSAWIISMPVAYEIKPDGSIITGRGKNTGWLAEQILDTGKTAMKH